MQREKKNENKKATEYPRTVTQLQLGIPEEEERQRSRKKIIEVVMAKNFPKLMTEPKP